MKDTDKRKKSDRTGFKINRRTLLKGGAAAAGVTAAGSLTIFSRTARAADTLRVLCWPGYEEKDVIQEFEDTHGVNVEFKIYIGGEQMLQFFNQTPRGTYDNVLADAEYIRKLAAIDAVEPYNPGEVPELANYHPKFNDMHQVQAGDGMVWGTPTRFSFYAISYNSDHMSFEESGDWNSLFLPKFQGKIGIFDWYLPNMGNASLAVHPNKENPYDLTDEQLGAVRDWLLRLRPQVNMFGSGAQAIVQAMINGDVVAGMIGDLDIDLKLAGYTNMESTIPVQGGS